MEENPQNTPNRKKGLQILLPLFPVEATLINHLVAVQKKDETVYYFNGSMPIFNLCTTKTTLTALDISPANLLQTAFANRKTL